MKRAVQLEQELAARLAQLKVRSGDVSSELVTLRELERDATAKRAVYESYLLRARETGEQKDVNTANISVISEATRRWIQPVRRAASFRQPAPFSACWPVSQSAARAAPLKVCAKSG